MNTIQKKYGVLLAAGGIAVCMAAGLMIGIQDYAIRIKHIYLRKFLDWLKGNY